MRYLTIEQAQRLLNACAPELRPLIRGALETGMRLGELTRLQCSDFNPASGTVHVRRSKSGRERHVVLTHDGIDFFRSITTGRSGLIFHRKGKALDEERGPVWFRARQCCGADRAGNHIPWAAPYLGLARDDEWNAATNCEPKSAIRIS